MIDAHVHLFPDKLYDAVWRWFDAAGWVIRDKLYADAAVDRLESSGVTRAVALPYVHRPGLARELNAFTGALARRRSLVVAGGTAHPLDIDVGAILREAKEVHGARVVKQHCHVLAIAPDDPRMFPLYEACIELALPLVLHAGDGPALPGYPAPPRSVSGAARVEAVLVRYPELRLVVPHLGATEVPEFTTLLERHAGLYLDTAMAMAAFAPGVVVGDRSLLARFPGRILFGTDFPHIPHPPEREREIVEGLGLDPATLHEVLHGAAARLLGLDDPRLRA
jgi:predicted TIM-barrel fold metal-dependent hydrolase